MRTVPINEAEYCVCCPNFEPELKTAKYYAGNEVLTVVNEIVCEHAALCKQLVKRLKEMEGKA